jgi:flagella synthesis protein FlgN
MAENLHRELESANLLLDVLREEQERLLSSGVSGLEEIVTRKAELLVQLNGYTQYRHDSLSLEGHEPTLRGMKTWLESDATKPDIIGIEKDWNELLEVTRSAKELNRLNGMLISSHLAKNQQALSILRGGRHDTGIYGPDGQPSRSATPVRSVITG